MIKIQHELLSLMDSGGPIMWVILLVACVAMVMLMWQGLQLLRFTKSVRLDYHRLRTDGDYVPSMNESDSPVAQLLTAFNWPRIQSKDDLVKEINIHLAEITPKIEGNLATIAILGSLLPMLGLLGTVTGMINVFETIALYGSGKPNEMADGISQALLTTASGLIIAIPVIFLHHLLSRRAHALMTIIHQAIQLILHHDVTKLIEVHRHGSG